MIINGKEIKKFDSTTQEELVTMMENHAEMAGRIYETAIDFGITNSQEFINWQDNINSCSYIHEEDLSKVK